MIYLHLITVLLTVFESTNSDWGSREFSISKPGECKNLNIVLNILPQLCQSGSESRIAGDALVLHRH